MNARKGEGRRAIMSGIEMDCVCMRRDEVGMGLVR